MSDWPSFDGLRIEQRLQSEGVTECYLAIQEELSRKVTIKALRPNVLPSSPFATALKREAEILGELCHQHVQRLYDFRCTGSQLWLVLEYLEGGDLAAVLAKLGPLPPLAVVSLGFMVASALAHCHEHGIVHRSISPKCIHLAPSGAATVLGFVGAIKDRLPTAPELLDGAPHLAVSPYFSPEQVLGETVDARSDIFSLGVVLYEALTGKNPFAGPDDRSVAQRIRKDKVPPFSRHTSAIPNALERTILRCLEKMPQDRFATAEELSVAFAGLLRQHEIVSKEAELRRAIASYFDVSIVQSKVQAAPTGTKGLAQHRPVRSGLIGLALGSLLIASGGFLLQGKQTTEPGPQRRSGGRLELAPEDSAYLRIVADPWATVSIDGQEIGTTPLGRAIALPSGTHFIQLEHPRASIERRSIHLASGETVLLDVKMNVAPSSESPPTASALAPDAGNSP